MSTNPDKGTAVVNGSTRGGERLANPSPSRPRSTITSLDVQVDRQINARETAVAREVAKRLTRGNVRIQQGKFITEEEFEVERVRLRGIHFGL